MYLHAAGRAILLHQHKYKVIKSAAQFASVSVGKLLSGCSLLCGMLLDTKRKRNMPEGAIAFPK
jgi:hypothetical protein